MTKKKIIKSETIIECKKEDILEVEINSLIENGHLEEYWFNNKIKEITQDQDHIYFHIETYQEFEIGNKTIKESKNIKYFNLSEKDTMDLSFIGLDNNEIRAIDNLKINEFDKNIIIDTLKSLFKKIIYSIGKKED